MVEIKRFLLDESGATAIEYALIATLVSVGAIVGLTAMSGQLGVIFDHVATAFTAALSG